MKKFWLVAFVLLIPAVAFAHGGHGWRGNWGGHWRQQYESRQYRAPAPKPAPVSAPKPTPAPTPTPSPTPTAPAQSGSEITFKAYVTAYTYWDNTPPGSADIALPVLHSKAGGTGTYNDPITLAVGHVISGGKDTPDFPKGTKFYMPYLQRYFIVEDVCGDGGSPQNGPCHTGYPSSAKAWLDIWIDGKSGSNSASQSCANAVTDVHTVIQNPASNYKVMVGPVFNGSCSQQFGESAQT